MDWGPMEWIGVQLEWIEVKVKALNQERALIQKCVFWIVFLPFHQKHYNVDQISSISAQTWMAWGQLEWIGIQCLCSVSFSGFFF